MPGPTTAGREDPPRMPEPTPHATSPPQLASPNGLCARVCAARRAGGVPVASHLINAVRGVTAAGTRRRLLSARTGG